MHKIFDGHSDLFEDVYEKRNRGIQNVIEEVHTPKWEKANCTGGFYPVWVDPYCEVYDMPVEKQFEGIFAQMQAELSACKKAKSVANYAEYESAIEAGKHALILGSEGLSYLHGDYDKLNSLYDSKFRVFSFTWNEDNEFACGAGTKNDHGLTTDGKSAVNKLEALGAIVDLAHSSKKTFFDTVSMATKPFIVSHGNAAALTAHPRNYTDEQLKLIRDYDGVIGISTYPPFVRSDKDKQTLRSYCEHIRYVADLIGVDHVGLGFDFVDFLDDFGTDESISMSVTGLESIDKAQSLVNGLKSMGFQDNELDKVFHGNFERIIQSILK